MKSSLLTKWYASKYFYYEYFRSLRAFEAGAIPCDLVEQDKRCCLRAYADYKQSGGLRELPIDLEKNLINKEEN